MPNRLLVCNVEIKWFHLGQVFLRPATLLTHMVFVGDHGGRTYHFLVKGLPLRFFLLKSVRLLPSDEYLSLLTCQSCFLGWLAGEDVLKSRFSLPVEVASSSLCSANDPTASHT